VDLVYSRDQVQGWDVVAEAIPVGVYGGAIVTYVVRKIQRRVWANARAAGAAYESVADGCIGPCAEDFDWARVGG
jgi:hypothetical protein